MESQKSQVDGLLSVITPVFNGERYIVETLSSILNSDFPNIEVLVVDDGSTDASARLAKTVLASGFRDYRFFSVQNGGEASADNFAFRHARGEFVAVVNADDPVMPNLFSESVKRLESNENLVAVYPDWNMIDENGNLIRAVETQDYSPDLLIGDNVCIPGPGAVFRRSAVCGQLRNSNYPKITDYAQWLQLAKVGPFERIPVVLANWRVHSSQTSANLSGAQQRFEMLECIKDYFSQADLPFQIRSLRNQAISTAFFRLAQESLVTPKVQGRIFLIRSLCIPFRRRHPGTVIRRSPLAACLILLNPVGRWLATSFESPFLKRRGKIIDS